MTIGLSTALRTQHVDNINAALNAGAGPGLMRVYDGTRPATAGAATTLLAELTLSDPAAPGAVSGVLTFSAITQDSSANATGTGTWCRFVDSTGAFVMDGSVGASGSGADYILNTTSITSGVAVTCSSGVLTAGNL
jgi:hypothetical protein